MSILDAITELSHEFGSTDYVKGGGGNTSCKDVDTLWVKPSGTTLAAMTSETFVALDRAKIAPLFAAATPADPAAREALVKDIMAAAVKPGSSGRPSVEAPLHESHAISSERQYGLCNRESLRIPVRCNDSAGRARLEEKTAVPTSTHGSIQIAVVQGIDDFGEPRVR